MDDHCCRHDGDLLERRKATFKVTTSDERVKLLCDECAEIAMKVRAQPVRTWGSLTLRRKVMGWTLGPLAS